MGDESHGTHNETPFVVICDICGLRFPGVTHLEPQRHRQRRGHGEEDEDRDGQDRPAREDPPEDHHPHQARDKAPPPASKEPLTTAQISAGIKANLAKLGPCMQAAKKRKEMKPGKHVLVLDFLILPNGSVREAALTGPDYLVKTRTAKCLANKVRTWRFPPSAKGSPVRKLQLPVSVK